jgi:hypothetical protein
MFPNGVSQTVEDDQLESPRSKMVEFVPTGALPALLRAADLWTVPVCFWLT